MPVQEEQTIIDLNEQVNLTFALRYLTSFTKATSLSPTVVSRSVCFAHSSQRSYQAQECCTAGDAGWPVQRVAPCCCPTRLPACLLGCRCPLAAAPTCR
jgi:hypothetical protein